MAAADYSYFLNGWNPETDTLVAQALEDMQRSGLTPDTLEAAQARIFNGSSEILRKRLGFAKVDGHSLLQEHRLIEFPYFSESGAVERYEFKPFPPIFFKGAGESHKYLQAKGQEPIPYIPVDTWKVKEKPNRPLWVTEGIKKALRLLQHGRHCVSLSGVWNFKASKARAEEESSYLWRHFKSFSLKGRTVYVAFDQDLWVNPQVRKALYELAFKLFLFGAVIRFPVWTEAKGIDDYLALWQDPDEALADLETEAKGLEAFLSYDHRGEIMPALCKACEDPRGTPDTRPLIALAAKKLLVKPKELTQDIVRHRQHRMKERIDKAFGPYFINEEGGACRWRRGRDGTEEALELANFTARIVEDVTIDNGREIKRRFAIDGETKGGSLPVVRVSTADFKGLSWVTRAWGNDAIVRAGQATGDYFREFVQEYSRHVGVGRKQVYAHTGWRNIGGSMNYLMANGALGNGAVDVELPGGYLEAGRYCLPATPENETEAITAALSFLHIGKPEITYPAFACIFLSVMTTLLDPIPAFSLYFYGERDTLKTAVAVVMLAFFGKHTRVGLSNFDSTANAIAEQAACLQDTLMLVDDYYPSAQGKEAAKKESIAQRLIRDCGNRTGRGRLNPDASEKPRPVPLGMVLITGELIPSIQSTLSRIIALEFENGSIDAERLSTIQEQARLLPHAMTSFILWLQQRIPEIQGAFSAQFYELRRRVILENGSRKVPEHVTFLYFAAETAFKWMRERGVLTPRDEKDASSAAWHNLMQVAQRHALRVEREDPAKFFFGVVDALLTQGKARLDSLELGYDARKTIGGDSGELLGYYDADFYYLLPEPLWLAVNTRLRGAGEAMSLSKVTFYDILERRGYVERDRQGHGRTHKRRIDGKVTSVLRVAREKIDFLVGTSSRPAEGGHDDGAFPEE